MREAYVAWQDQSRAWSQLLVSGQIARTLHDMAASSHPAVVQAIETLEDLDPWQRAARARA